MYFSDKQRDKCLEAVTVNYEIKRENRAKLKIRLIGLYKTFNKDVSLKENQLIRGSVKNYLHFMLQHALVFKFDAIFPASRNF